MRGNTAKPSTASQQHQEQSSTNLPVAHAQAAAAAVQNNTKVASPQEILPPAIEDSTGKPYLLPQLQKIVKEYWDWDISEESKSVALSHHSIFEKGDARLYVQTFVIARDHVLTGGPLDALEAAVKDNPKVLLPQIKITTKLAGEVLTLKGTLEELAMILLDHTIASDQGMAELLRELRKNLLPLSVPQARTAPKNEEKKDETIEATHLEVLNNIFDMIKQKKFNSARDKMKTYIKSLKPGVLTDNKYFLNLIQLIALAFNVLKNRVQELNELLYGTGTPIQYCNATAGVIETALSFVLRKRLKKGIFLLLNNYSTDRAIDVSDDFFIGEPGSVFEVGVKGFIDYLGVNMNYLCTSMGLGTYESRFSDLYQQLHHATIGHSTEERIHDLSKYAATVHKRF